MGGGGGVSHTGGVVWDLCVICVVQSVSYLECVRCSWTGSSYVFVVFTVLESTSTPPPYLLNLSPYFTW